MVMAKLAGRLRRWTYLLHRWCGIAGCLLMALWFASGITMLFVGYPKLTPWDRLQALPVLATAGQVLPSQALAGEGARQLVFNAVNGQARYIVKRDDGAIVTVDGATGQRATALDAAGALASARLFLAGAPASYLGEVGEDRWTHGRALDVHRPLHQVQMGDAAHTLLYVSSHSGEIVMQAPRTQRLLNYVGAWLHWLYVFKNQPVDPVWTWTVIVLSALCVLVACSGILVGIWRWRFSKPYKSGSRSPFAPGWMRWHHVLGLGFSVITLTWIFSGLMSMNPLGVFSATARPDLARYAGATPGQKYLDAAPDQILQALSKDGFKAVELEWCNLAGQSFVVARSATGEVRLVRLHQGHLVVQRHWEPAQLVQAATGLYPAPLVQQDMLSSYDAYYYRRDPEAMMGGAERPLPVLRLDFADAGQSRVYIDPATGEVLLSADNAERIGRWLFSFLHSWDLSPMLASGVFRELVLIVLSLGGLGLAGSAVVIGYARVRRKLRP